MAETLLRIQQIGSRGHILSHHNLLPLGKVESFEGISWYILVSFLSLLSSFLSYFTMSDFVFFILIYVTFVDPLSQGKEGHKN